MSYDIEFIRAYGVDATGGPGEFVVSTVLAEPQDEDVSEAAYRDFAERCGIYPLAGDDQARAYSDHGGEEPVIELPREEFDRLQRLASLADREEALYRQLLWHMGVC